MTNDELLEGIIQREGGDTITNDPSDRGGRTRYGVSERAHPELWKKGPPTLEQAKALYNRLYVAPFAPLVHVGIDERVRVALIDEAVHSGPKIAIKNLQQVLGIPADGVIGPQTIGAVIKANGDGQWLLTRLVQNRAKRLARIVEQDYTQARFITGWIVRALSMLG